MLRTLQRLHISPTTKSQGPRREPRTLNWPLPPGSHRVPYNSLLLPPPLCSSLNLALCSHFGALTLADPLAWPTLTYYIIFKNCLGLSSIVCLC